MKAKSTRLVDDLGRIVIPKHVRAHLNINPGSHVEVFMEDDGSIRIRRVEKSCSICGKPVDGKEHAKLDKGSGTKHVCGECIAALAREIINQM